MHINKVINLLQLNYQAQMNHKKLVVKIHLSNKQKLKARDKNFKYNTKTEKVAAEKWYNTMIAKPRTAMPNHKMGK